MTIQIFLFFLFGISLLTGLFVQAIKKLLGEFKKKIGSNLLSSIVSIVLSILVGVFYPLLFNVQVDIAYVIWFVIIAIFSWLVAMLGYDKVKQTILQIFGGKLNGSNND